MKERGLAKFIVQESIKYFPNYWKSQFKVISESDFLIGFLKKGHIVPEVFL